MQAIDLLVVPRWLAPVRPANVALADHALAVDDGRIIDILPRDFAEQQYAPRDTLTLDHHVVAPGLINAHTHAAMSLLRGLADDLPLMQWLSEYIWPAEGQHVDRQFCVDGTRLAVAEMIRGGTTCFSDMYFFGDAAAEVVGDAGSRAVIGLIVLDFPTIWAGDADEYIHKALTLHDDLAGRPRIRTTFAPHAPYSVSDDPLRKVRRYADELNIPIHMHLHETAHEVAESVEHHGKTPLQRMVDLGLAGPDFLAVHMTQLTDADIAACAEHGLHAVHCPQSNLKLASGFTPVTKLLASGVNIALGTDGAASNNDLDMFDEMRSAALLAKGVSGDAGAVPAEAALEMATINGALALGLDGEIGSLEVGKAADFIAVDLDHPATQPVYHPISQLVYAASREQVSDVYVAGRALLRGGEFVDLDLPATLANAAQWRERIAS